MRKLRWLIAALLAMASPSLVSAQGAGTITGTVTAAGTDRPIAGVRVAIPSAQVGTQTDEQGRFRLTVPAGQYTLQVSNLGYTPVQRPVTVAAGQTATVNIALAQQVVALEELVVTGVAGPTSQANLPIVVSQIDSAQLQVTATTAAGAIAGKVAGARVVAGSGLPGSEPAILLRGPKSISGEGRGQNPLYIVDGVILGSGLADINSEDIESIEVVKGAAAASLYGSRAANGVIQIRTKRGRGLPEGETRYTFRTEYGVNDLERSVELAQSHPYLMNGAGTRFLNANGQEFDYNETTQTLRLNGPGANAARSFQVNQWPQAERYDNLERFFDPGTTLQNYLAIEGRAGNTNYHASYTRNEQGGIVYNQEGYQRNAFRLNLDQGFGSAVQLSTNVYYSQATQDQFAEGSGATLYNLMLALPFVDLTAMNEETGQINHMLEPRSNEDNPLYALTYRDVGDERERFTGGGNLRWEPINWFSVDGNFSFDRLNFQRRDYYPSPYYTTEASSVNKGALFLRNDVTQAWNGSVTATVNREFGAVQNTTQLRYLVEEQSYERFDAGGRQFLVKNTPNLNAITPNTEDVFSSQEDVNSEGYFFITNFNIDSRYILDALVRRDGSSLFGENERWQTYYRGAAAWRVSQEPWFNLGPIGNLKLRYSYGTAGGRPIFDAQYETYTVTSAGIRGRTLGNKDLKPELAKEHEAGVDLTFLNRFDASVTYAKSVVEDQILRVPLPAATGFQAQWRNAGTLASNTWEASLEARLFERGSTSWTARVLYDRTRQEITELNVPAFRYGFPTQGVEEVFYAREGESLGTFYGTAFARGCGDLPSGTDCSQFQVNDDGYLVYVGGSSWQSGPGPDGKPGTADDLWGTSGTVNGSSYAWGMPIKVLNEDGLDFTRIGQTTPDFNLSFSSNLDWRGFSFYGLLDGSFGFDIYNLTRQWAFRDYRGAAQDQTGKAPGEMKPVQYHQVLYNVASVSDAFVEDGSFVKLRELSARYTFGRDQLRGMRIGGLDRVSIGLVGRNLLTFTEYSGFDPETGFSGGEAGSAVINRFDAYRYPSFRTVTAQIEIGF